MTPETLSYLLGAAMLAVLFVVHRDRGPETPAVAPADPEWVLLPFKVIGGLAGLCWCLLGLAAFLAPLAALAWLVVR